MAKRNIMLLTASMVLGGICHTVVSCPTCIGRIEKNSPAFFSNDAYNPYPPEEKDDTDKEKLPHSEKNMNNHHNNNAKKETDE